MHIGGTVKTCTAKFVSRKLMQRHIKDLHRYQSPEEKQCKYCKKELKTVKVKKEHGQSREGKIYVSHSWLWKGVHQKSKTQQTSEDCSQSVKGKCVQRIINL